MEAIQTTASWRSARMPEESWRLETCCYSDSNEKLSANVGVKNSQTSKMIVYLE